MHGIVRDTLNFLLRFGVLGLLGLSIADASFLFFPVGNDLLTVVLVARNHSDYAWCVVAAAGGSAIGVLLLDLVVRKGGEEGLEKLIKRRRLLDYLKQRMQARAAIPVVIACLAPPPFPFEAVIVAAIAFQYSRTKLLTLVFLARGVRFTLVGWAAIHFGRQILDIAKLPAFFWGMIAFIAVCTVGSVISVLHWIRIGRSR